MNAGQLADILAKVPRNWPVRFVDNERGRNIYFKPLESDDLHRDAEFTEFRVILTEEHFVIEPKGSSRR